MSAMSLSARVQKLFDAANSAGRTDTAESVAVAVGAALSRTLSRADIQALLDGADTPDNEVLTAVAAHFEAPASYLTGTPEEQADYDAQLDFYFSLTTSQLSTIALRARNANMPSAAVNALTNLINETHEKYGDPNGQDS